MELTRIIDSVSVRFEKMHGDVLLVVGEVLLQIKKRITALKTRKRETTIRASWGAMFLMASTF